MKRLSTTLMTIALVLVTAVAAAQTGSADGPRTALVVGNSEYSHFGDLRNPGNDAADVAGSLEELGFEVTLLVDAAQRDLFEAVRDFGDKLARDKGLGLFYYAGHGIEVGGTNYLIPTDADIQAEDEVQFASIAVDFVLSKMETAGNASNILILDACRDNPLPASRRSASAARGLSVVQAPTGSLIVYATDPGEAALDGTGRNSPFTDAFLEHVRTPGLDVEFMFRNVRADVIEATGGAQTPWTNSSLTGSIVLAGGAATGWPITGDGQGGIAIRRALGSLEVSTRDPGDLYVDGEFLVSLRRDETITLDNVTAGIREVEIRYGNRVETQEAEVPEDDAAEMVFTYEADPRFTLNVDPGIDGLAVYVDGRRVASTPAELDLAAGTRSLEIRGDYVTTMRSRVTGESRETVGYAPELTRLGRLTISGSLPDGAEVLLDGSSAGFSGTSDLVPIGDYEVSVRHPLYKDNSTAATVRYGATTRVRPNLVLRTGAVHVLGLPPHVEARIDDGPRPETVGGDAVFDELVIGSQTVVMESRYGVAYRRTVEVAEDQEARITAPRAELSFSDRPEETELRLNNVPVGRTVSSMELLPGSYEVTLTGDWIEPLSQTVRLSAGSASRLDLRRVELGAVEVVSADTEGVLAVLERLGDAGSGSAVPVALGEPTRLPAGDYRLLARASDDLEWSTERIVFVEPRKTRRVDLGQVPYSVAYRIGALENTRADLQAALVPQVQSYDGLTVGGWVSLGTGIAGAGLAVVSYFLANTAHADYTAATITADVTAARNRYERWTTLFAVGAGVGGAGISLGPILWLLRPDTSELETEIGNVQRRIEELEGQR